MTNLRPPGNIYVSVNVNNTSHVLNVLMIRKNAAFSCCLKQLKLNAGSCRAIDSEFQVVEAETENARKETFRNFWRSKISQ